MNQKLSWTALGLTNSEANHGQDVKEYYCYLDGTPTHSHIKYLYKYSQREYPYRYLIETNRERSRNEFDVLSLIARENIC
jgi:hypothetical protein